MIFIIYGSLIPFELRPLTWDQAITSFQNIRYLQLGIGSRADLVANFILYIPLSFLAAASWLRPSEYAGKRIFKLMFIFISCISLAISIEFIQLFFAPRTVSLNDLTSEILGSAVGLVTWSFSSRKLRTYASKLRIGGLLAVRALLIIYFLAYFLLNLFPFDFIISSADLEWKLNTNRYHAILSHASCVSFPECTGKLSAEILATLPIGILLGIIFTRGRKYRFALTLVSGLAIGAILESIQFFIASGISQGISVLTRTLGIALGLLLYDGFNIYFIRKLQRFSGLKTWISLLLTIYIGMLSWLSWTGKGTWTNIESGMMQLADLNFLPFYYHYYTSESEALTNLLYNGALYFPIGLLVWAWHLPILHSPNRPKIINTAIIATLFALTVETGKLFLTGTHPDPTNILVANFSSITAFLLMHFFIIRFENSPSTLTGNTQSSSKLKSKPNKQKIIIASLFIAIIAGATLRLLAPIETIANDDLLPRLPLPYALPKVSLANFKYEHPRLPSPSRDDIRLIKKKNPQYFNQHRRQAKSGEGKLYSTILMAKVEPGSQDINRIHQRLLDLKFDWRGHLQVKPLAVGYDWLYQQWTPKQRAQLQTKLNSGCNYLINYIRIKRLSPYNVYLYNSPFQALIACSIAGYGDSLEAEPVMRFTYDLWKNRVLPVWRQIMGDNGGWHEGGEYVGIGIGQAIYQVPAMWRKATGEDLFKTEPGIRGFLDFLIYRIRPDGTHFRWGDAAFFDRIIPDGIPLSIEFNNKAAYSLFRPQKIPTPTAWPWGPLTDINLYDKNATSRLPLSRFFDGIGMLVTRSDWSKDATYVTFKAGDNYWSHSHLDQGAFTIYKGGPLAIDSGLYGPSYGSDHHINYSYQTIAHNTITVNDPEDTTPKPTSRDQAQNHIANDGGQRRIGSGWGIESAPLDLTEWQSKKEIYHTGKVKSILIEDGLNVVVADITPAYTNNLSGKGTFSHRTKRVESLWRTFGYDNVDDVIVIFDQVISTQANFRKKWLLHTIEEPVLNKSGFSVSFHPNKIKTQAEGHLEAHVLLPENSNIISIGGKGLEYFVDNHNYDDNGKVAEAVKRRRSISEPGAWRVEILPPKDAKEDKFLVVLLPSTSNNVAPYKIRRLGNNGKLGCEIVGPKRITRWWFNTKDHSAQVEIFDGNIYKEYNLQQAKF